MSAAPCDTSTRRCWPACRSGSCAAGAESGGPTGVSLVVQPELASTQRNEIRVRCKPTVGRQRHRSGEHCVFMRCTQLGLMLRSGLALMRICVASDRCAFYLRFVAGVSASCRRERAAASDENRHGRLDGRSNVLRRIPSSTISPATSVAAIHGPGWTGFRPCRSTIAENADWIRTTIRAAASSATEDQKRQDFK